MLAREEVLMNNRMSFCRFSVLRRLHGSAVVNGKRTQAVTHANAKAPARESRFLRKMMGVNQKKKRYSIPRTSHWESLAAITFHQPGTGIKTPVKVNVKRIAMLNAMLMEYITDIMGSGEISSRLIGKGIEVTRVKISNDYTFLNVYWICHGSMIDEDVQKLLESVSGPLRNELTQLYLMSYIPKIVFVNDPVEGNEERVQRLLDGLDVGEEVEQLHETREEPAHQMRNDLLGLNRDAIMEEIIATMKKASAPHRNELQTFIQSEARETTEAEIIERRSVNFKKFLEERKRVRAKIIRKQERENAEALRFHQYREDVQDEEETEDTNERWDVWEEWERISEQHKENP